jgi:carbohydrate-selective porin OprB
MRSPSAQTRRRARSGARKLPIAAALLVVLVSSPHAQTPPTTEAASPGIAGNPGAVDVQAGTGALGRLLGLDPATGIRLGGVLVSNGNYLLSGGNNPGRASFNNLLVIDLGVDLDKLAGISGATLGAALLRFDGQPTNQQAGLATGYNGLPGARPLDRTELYELWWRQSFFDDKLVVRFGKVVPTFDFGNVVRPVPVENVSLQIPAVSSLIYTPIFVNPTILGALPGYYNSFTYQAGSWSKPRRVIAKVEWHLGELYPRVGFIVTNMPRPAENVVAFYNKRGTCEQWIKEGKGAIKWTRLSCRSFAATAVRLQLHALA